MITHVVLMKFKAENKAANMLRAKAELEGMVGRVAVLRALEVGLNVLPSERAFDLSLITRFSSLDDLAAYATDPVHVAVKHFLSTVLEASFVVDSETA